jgi:tripartite-type tricarboxylate transporter receptor subunit TctC
MPAIAEELPGYEIIAWFALVAPARLPEPIVQRLHEANMKALAKPEIKEKFAAIGTDVAPLNPAELGRFIQAEVGNWAKLVKLAKIEPE